MSAIKISREVKVGIYDSEYVARVYTDKITLVAPYVRWMGNTGGYAERKLSIRDQTVVIAVRKELDDACVDSAWDLIGRATGEDYLLAIR